MDLAFYRESVTQHGVGATLYHAAFRAANLVAPVAAWDAIVLTPDKLDRAFLGRTILAKRYEGRMVGAAEMRPYATDSALGAGCGLTPTFLDEAVETGDRCYAFFEGDSLVNYSWYTDRSKRLTEVSSVHELRFDPAYTYTYNGFTHPSHRGNRLHALGMSAALEQLTKKGHRGFVSYVDSANLASLKSCARMGYEVFGHVALLKVGHGYVFASSHGCKKYGFRVVKVAS
jgi:L-amino acid N-acyltransferase YncA